MSLRAWNDECRSAGLRRRRARTPVAPPAQSSGLNSAELALGWTAGGGCPHTKKSWTAGGGCPTQKSHPARGPDGKNGKGQILVGGGVGCGFWSRLLGADAHAVERAIDERD